MADPLLNTLCTICHTNAPKYTCPCCSALTCSLPCTKKHKSWADCTGKRDPTAYMPVSRLKTPAGIDHDYNFLSAIERERDRNQRELVEDKKLLTEKEVRGLDDPYKFRKQWFGEKVRFHPVSAGIGPRAFGSDGEKSDAAEEGDDGGDGNARRASHLTRKVRSRLDNNNIEVVQMPVGMVRQRENTTSWNRRAGRINWCVEWMIYDPDPDSDPDSPSSSLPSNTHTRIRHKALETMPLYKALGNSMAWYKKGQQKEEAEDEEDEEALSTYARKRRRVLIKEVKEDGLRSAMQDDESATWTATPYPTQNPYSGIWGLDRGALVTSWLPDEEIEARSNHRFYLLKPLTPAGTPKELIPLESSEMLSTALQGRTVLEFPTVYVLPPSSSKTPALPEGFILGSTERRPRARRQKEAKRKATERGSRSQPPHKRQAIGEGGVPIRPGGPNRRGRGRGGARGARGARGGRFQAATRAGRDRSSDAEEGQINSDGDEAVQPEVTADAADTTSSDPDTSSDDEGGLAVGDSSDEYEQDQMDVDDDDDDEPPEEVKSSSRSAAPGPAGRQQKAGLGLVNYGSDSDESDGGEDEDVDLTKLEPEDPELVAGAIQEIVGLLS